MTVGFFYTPNQLDTHRLALKAMCRGVSKREDCFIKYDSQYKKCDLAATWSIYKKKFPYTKTREIIHRSQESRNKKIMVIERGYINRDKYYSVGYNSQNGWADFKNKDMPSDRWSSLGVELKEYRKDGGHILLCGQVPWDTSVQHVDYENWCADITEEIKKHTKRPIIFRPHPLAADKIKGLPNVTTSTKTSLKEDLEDCWAVVAFNSNSLVEALIEGVPTFGCDVGSMIQGVSNKLVDLDDPKLYSRRQWAHDIAYSQWTMEEMAEGLTWSHLK